MPKQQLTIAMLFLTVLIVCACSDNAAVNTDTGLDATQSESDNSQVANGTDSDATDENTAGTGATGNNAETEEPDTHSDAASDNQSNDESAPETTGTSNETSPDSETDEDVGCEDEDSDGWCAEFDCDDQDASIHPNTPEVPNNGVDDNCDGRTDEAQIDEEADTDTFNECASVSQTAELEILPADIIIVVDNSGSMTDEAEMVQNNLNDFSQQIIASGVDAHVVLVSGYEDEFNNGICVESPLGSGDCPGDSNLPTYKHVDKYISSHYGPKWATDEYEEWADMLRTNAKTHFLFVSDDNPYQNADDFNKILSELEPPITDYTVHAIAADVDPEVACGEVPKGPCCEYATNEGVDYKQMVSNTGGVFGDLCLQEFQGVFGALATAVSQLALECEWAIPAPPQGETLDPEKVNLDIVDDQGATVSIGYVPSAGDCASVLNGWYYDNPANPKEMKLCDQTCEWIRGLTSAQILVKFGCTTHAAQPK